MSALGQKQTFAPQKGVFDLAPKADTTARTYDVHPNSESGHALGFSIYVGLTPSVAPAQYSFHKLLRTDGASWLPRRGCGPN